MIDLTFRAWDIRNKKMIYNVLGGFKWSDKKNENIYHGIFEYLNSCSLGEYHIMIASPFFDKKNNRIYEYDIIRGYYLDENNQIDKNNYCDSLVEFNTKYGFSGIDFEEKTSIFYYKDCEIIGNFYEQNS